MDYRTTIRVLEHLASTFRPLPVADKEHWRIRLQIDMEWLNGQWEYSVCCPNEESVIVHFDPAELIQAFADKYDISITINERGQ
jgi:hypothetical protein